MNSVRQTLDAAWQHYRKGEWPQAEQLYLQVLEVAPHQVDALHLLGVIAGQTGRISQASEYLQAVLRLQPGLAAAHNNLGNVFNLQGKLAEALASFQEAVRLQPDFVVAHHSLGNALREQGRLEEAEDSFRQALRIKPDFADAHFNLGTVLWTQRRLEEAVTSYQQALRIKPDHALAHNNLGNVYVAQGKLAEAVASFQEAVRLQPGFAAAHNDLGIALHEQGRVADAKASYQQALRIQPDYAMAHNNLGNALREEGRLAEAEASYQQALRIQPDCAMVYNNLGSVLKDQGRLDDAIAAFRTALRLKPEAAVSHSNLIFTLNFHPRYDARAIQEECVRWNRQHAEPLKQFIQPHTNRPDPERRLRIGYLSPHFHNHVYSFFAVPLLSNHDHRQFEIFCYAGVARPDVLTERLRGCADVWRSTVGLSDPQLADLVRRDQIDILVDLIMHSPKNRLLLFARKPAPVQVSWLSYPGTTGLSTIDYRLTDPYLDPAGLFDAYYTEQSVRLLETFWCYDPLTEEPPVNALPASATGVITFGCLNNFCKINDGCLQLWARVLRAVPKSRLLLIAPLGSAREHVTARLQQEGIDPLRVEFIARQPRLEYLRLYHRIDLGLDPLPYNGGTTTLDAFWMGVPTLTLVGKTVVGRAGWSQLCNLGLQELAAESPEQFVALAARLARDLPWLEELRGSLRQRMQQSPLMDGKRFARHMEQAYRWMWQRWCQGARRHEPA
jgi:predicted O-linked N-acetylglucosamine transferase (SPINDLY family)